MEVVLAAMRKEQGDRTADNVHPTNGAVRSVGRFLFKPLSRKLWKLIIPLHRA